MEGGEDGGGKQRWRGLKRGGRFTPWKEREKEKQRIRQQNGRGWRGRTEGGDSKGERKGEGEWVSACAYVCFCVCEDRRN